ncbi:succinylglutamate desuccinylase [Chimaeribacter californicus]|uniref:Succinylglutamate desuccinylase n=1 Tax=Chimaeribacter californicus TaxID=2060067 RepID=A0A2N5E2Z5_9GAMM|nr:succinylglutamate desuccinylase [Chimaeribacter californicus]PLR35076.1 succinylglutamate desuccinylase [Chimaeribacter californicus]
MQPLTDQLLHCTLPDLPLPAALHPRWLAEGVLELRPEHARRAVVVSAGIHGNETAPVELLLALVAAIGAGTLCPATDLLLVFGNLPAMRANRRYLHHDMNRLFGGRHRTAPRSHEATRAAELEAVTAAFFEHTTAPAGERWHLDMHTAIRGSLYPQFALVPFHAHAYSPAFFDLLAAAELDAVVQHTQVGGTFSHFVSEQFQAQSVTLELGKARPFGQNDLPQFAPTGRAIRALITGAPLPERQKPPVHHFTVAESIIKTSEQFTLNLPNEAENFTCLPPGYEIAAQPDRRWVVSDTARHILFPNAGVATGLRAGMLLAPGAPRLSLSE